MTVPRTDDLLLPRGIERLVVLGDPHGDLAGLETVLAREEGPGVAIVSAGDNVGYADGPTSSRLCRLLAGRRIPSVLGNHEAWALDDGELFLVEPPEAPNRLDEDALAWCRGLPVRLKIRFEDAPGVTVSLVHAHHGNYVSAENAGALAAEEAASVVFCGHSHGPAIYTVRGAVLAAKARLEPDGLLDARMAPDARYVVDAGSLGRPGFYPDPERLELATYAALDLRERRLEVRALAKSR